MDIYYKKGNRKREFLGIYLDPNDTKTSKDEKLKLAENLKAKRLIELIKEEKGIPSTLNLQMSFVEYYKTLLEKRIASTRITRECALIHLIKYSKNELCFADINEKWLDGLNTYLLKHVSPLSATTYIDKIKCALH